MAKCLSLVYRLEEDGRPRYEGDGMLLVWALKTCFYKHKAGV